MGQKKTVTKETVLDVFIALSKTLLRNILRILYPSVPISFKLDTAYVVDRRKIEKRDSNGTNNRSGS